MRDSARQSHAGRTQRGTRRAKKPAQDQGLVEQAVRNWQQAEEIRKAAQALLEKSDRVDRAADAVHKAADHLHKRLQAFHRRSRRRS